MNYIDFEKVIKTVIAFATPKRTSEFQEAIKTNPDVEAIYSEFVVNRNLPYIDMIEMIKKFQNTLPKNFKEKFIEYHKNFNKKKQQLSLDNGGTVVAVVDKFTIVNKYSDLARENTFETFKAVIKLIQDAVQKLKSHGFSSIIYGNVYLRNPVNPRALAEYNYDKDEIRLRLYKTYSGHALESVIHELAHRIWFVLMTHEDRRLWIKEYDAKMNNTYTGKYPGFPNTYSKTQYEEYFAVVIEDYIVNNKRFSELIDLIV